ncbi:glycosyltransferase [uncultured Desulfovibrio sp.]|uniref:glycosyltransferase family 2 protein n=1 Tax=uncultured Desulfovibrio sp. TaxID=167968 RepID=UPI002627096A|nr:glycosyltransferase [uncultured Desulfovibrio sp.]
MSRFHSATPSAPADVLQHIVLPEKGVKGADTLYVRQELRQNGRQRYITTTYINIFHWKRWQTLTGVPNSALEVTCMGCGRLCLLGASSTESRQAELFQELAHEDIAISHAGTFVIHLDGRHDFYALCWEKAPGDTFDIIHAAYVTKEQGDSPAASLTRLALIVPTYRRIEDVTHTASDYQAMCKASEHLAGATHMFVINNDAAEQSFPLVSGKNLTVIHNPYNFGGSGGFARGAHEAVSRGEFSHIVFMDDDAILHQETLFRTLSLLTRLKPVYRDQVLTGSMFTRELPSWCHVIQEGLNRNGIGEPIIGNRDLSSEEATVDTLETVQKNTPLPPTDNEQKKANPPLLVSRASLIRPYAAWWYCVIPAHLFTEYGYPRPVFFRGDDQEFGMRIQRYPLPLNGICVWHAAFANKQSMLRLYLGVRNNALTNILHFRKWRRNLLRQLLLKPARAIALRRYAEGAIRILAFQDFLHFADIPPEGERLIPRVLTAADRYPAEYPSQTPAPATPRRYLSPVLRSIITYLTLGSTLLPEQWRKSLAADWTGADTAKTLPPFHAGHALRLSLAAIRLLLRLTFLRRTAFLEKLPHYTFDDNSLRTSNKS